MKIFIFFILFSLTILGCEPGRKVGENIVIMDDDPSHTFIARSGNHINEIIVDEQIADTSEEQGMLFVLRKPAESFDCLGRNGKKTIITHYTPRTEFWILGIDEPLVLGPFDKERFRKKIREMNLDDPDLAEPESYRDNSRSFYKDISTCVGVKAA